MTRTTYRLPVLESLVTNEPTADRIILSRIDSHGVLLSAEDTSMCPGREPKRVTRLLQASTGVPRVIAPGLTLTYLAFDDATTSVEVIVEHASIVRVTPASGSRFDKGVRDAAAAHQ